MKRQLYAAVIIDYKTKQWNIFCAWLFRYWQWVNYAAESTNPIFLYTAPKLSHVDFSFSQSGFFHKGLDIEQYAKFRQKKLAVNKTNKCLAW